MTRARAAVTSDDQGAGWLGAIAGNTRLHWAVFTGERLLATWDGPHLQATATSRLAPLEAATQGAPDILQAAIAARLPLYWASVVAGQTQLLRQGDCPRQEITLERVPLQGLYPTLGIDRALALLGAGRQYGFPVLAIDSGTALTFTGADRDRTLVGGAILPGLTLQHQALARGTSALPAIARPSDLPVRWGRGTSEAIASGILYGAIAAIVDFSRAWRQDYPESLPILTGGDSPLLFACLQRIAPELAAVCRLDPQLGWAGLLGVRALLDSSN